MPCSRRVSRSPSACSTCCSPSPGIVLISPLLLALAVLVRLKLGRPVLFTPDAPWLSRANRFEMIKFRTMTDGRDASGELLPDEQRLTRLGRILRSYQPG